MSCAGRWGRFSLAVAAAVGLAGCANSDLGRQQQLRSGELAVVPSELAGFDYRVTLFNGLDVGFDPDVLADRQAQVRGLLATECKGVAFGPESVIRLGTTPFGRERRQYVMHVRCLR